jgi:hypothetical protein
VKINFRLAKDVQEIKTMTFYKVGLRMFEVVSPQWDWLPMRGNFPINKCFDGIKLIHVKRGTVNIGGCSKDGQNSVFAAVNTQLPGWKVSPTSISVHPQFYYEYRIAQL